VSCHADRDIEDFIYDFEVRSWYVQEMMDFNVFDSRPVHRVNEPFGKYLLNKHYSMERS
jgi:hypothetical protein